MGNALAGQTQNAVSAGAGLLLQSSHINSSLLILWKLQHTLIATGPQDIDNETL